MEKTDFKKGQTVYLKYVGDRRHGTYGDIIETKVLSVGSKYITVNHGLWKNETKFDISNDFREKYEFGGGSYKLYLTRQEIEEENEIDKIAKLIESQFIKYSETPIKLPLDKLRRIKAIIEE